MQVALGSCQAGAQTLLSAGERKASCARMALAKLSASGILKIEGSALGCAAPKRTAAPDSATTTSLLQRHTSREESTSGTIPSALIQQEETLQVPNGSKAWGWGTQKGHRDCTGIPSRA